MTNDIECIYWGIFFNADELPDGSLANEIEHKHITFGFRIPCPVALVGTQVPVTICGYGNDGSNEALLADFPEELEEFYQGADTAHITLSVAEGAKPVDSALLEFEERDAWEVVGTIGYFGKDQRVHLEAIYN